MRFRGTRSDSGRGDASGLTVEFIRRSDCWDFVVCSQPPGLKDIAMFFQDGLVGIVMCKVIDFVRIVNKIIQFLAGSGHSEALLLLCCCCCSRRGPSAATCMPMLLLCCCCCFCRGPSAATNIAKMLMVSSYKFCRGPSEATNISMVLKQTIKKI